MAEPTKADLDRSNEAALRKAVHDAYILTAQGSLERAATRVNILTGAIATVTTLYSGLLALVFAAEPGKGAVLTATALIPALFLGAALLLVSTYAAFFQRTSMSASLLPTGIAGRTAETRLITFLRWCSEAVLARSSALHAGILSFGLGIATMPFAFVTVPVFLPWVFFGAGVVGVAVVAIGPSRVVAFFRWIFKVKRA